ncbi:GxxExxY protein [Candidatus Poribacteria bacterium]|nr:GxxExxY protein [Candidatus Poribacteria bacterium]
MPKLLHKNEVYTIIGAAMEVYNVLGPGFLESVYQEALEIELSTRGISFESPQELNIRYKEYQLKQQYKPDFVVYEKIIVEIKALNHLTSHEQAQLLNYLKATGLPVGVLINFGAEKDLEWKRMVWSR